MERGSLSSLIAKLAILLIVPTLFYWQDFLLLANEALNSDLSTHIILIPFLLGYMVYRLKDVFLASVLFDSQDIHFVKGISSSDTFGVLLCTLSYIVKWYGSYTFNPLEYHVASIPILVSGLILLLFNKQTLRILIFPVIFLIFLIPPPITFAQQTGAYLAIISANLSFTLLKILGFPVILNDQLDAPIIYLERATGEVIPFAIDIACSGLYSFIGLVVFAVFFAYISKGALKKKLAVLLTSFPIIYATNVIRITILILIGFYLGTGLSFNVVHLLGGWILIFVGTLIILTLADKWFNINLFQQDSESCSHQINDEENLCLECGKILKTVTKPLKRFELLKLVTLLLASILLLSIQVPVFAISTGQSAVFTDDPNKDVKIMDVLPYIEGYELGFIYRDTDFESVSRQNASLWYRYKPEDRIKPDVWVGLEIAKTRSILHNWEICLIVMPARADRFTYNKVDLRDIHLLDNPPLTARYFAYHRVGENITEVILYWYTQSIFETTKGYKTLLTKITVLEYVYHPEEYLQAEEDILPVALAIADYWRPISTWSGIGISIARNGKSLIALIGVMLALALGYQNYLHRKRIENAKKIFNGFTDPEDINIIKSIRPSKNEPVREADIARKYAEITGETMDIEALHEKLVKAEKLGITQSRISNIDNEPILTWRSMTHKKSFTSRFGTWMSNLIPSMSS